MIRRLLAFLGALVVIVVLAGAAFVGWRLFDRDPEITAADVPVTQALIARGEYLVKAADCVACHEAPGGKPFAGGVAFKLPFGTIYSTNITADKETGIGGWSDDDFVRALHQGVAKDGSRLYPAFPYTSYTGLSRGDAVAMKAYLFSLPPVHAPPRPNKLSFPFNQRWTLAFWSLAFLDQHRFRPDPQASASENRGAYLATALGHCGECHTPRNFLQALDNHHKYAGAVQAGWDAYNISADHTSGIGGWSQGALIAYLGNGHADGHGPAGGPMAEAVGYSLRHLTSADLDALATYVSSVPAQAGNLPPVKAEPASPDYRQGPTTLALGQHIYEGACVSCHAWSGQSRLVPAMTLTGDRAVNDPSGLNVARVVLQGSALEGGAAMPGFGAAYSNAEIAAVVNYVTSRFGNAPTRLGEADIARLRETQ